MRSRLFGVLLFIETAALLLTALVAWHYHISQGENDYQYFLITAAITAGAGLLLYLIGGLRKRVIDNDDTFAIVSISWIVFSLFGMLPFLLSGAIDNVTDAKYATVYGYGTYGRSAFGGVRVRF